MDTLELANRIGGRRVPAAGGATLEDRDPGDTRQLVAVAPDSGPEDVDAAVAAAAAAWPGWAARPAPERGRVMGRLSRLIEARLDDLATLLTREMGKVLAEARGEVGMAVRIADYYGGAGLRLQGATRPSLYPGTFAATVREPVGVAGLITPWNFPVIIPLWKLAPALVAGNTAVLKPSELAPGVAALLVDLLEEAGLPPGVLNLVHGRGPTAGEALVRHPGVQAVSFTGSTAVGRRVYALAAEHGARVTCEMGGKNALVVLDDADVPAAVAAIAKGAFGTTGQRCTATSRVLAQRSVLDAVVEGVVAAARALRIGHGLDPATGMGPLSSEAQQTKVTGHLARAAKDGLTPLTGGGSPACDAPGHWVEPAVFVGVPADHPLAREEVFGPVVCAWPVEDLDEALAVTNDSEYGLSASVFTRDPVAAMRFCHEADVGVVHVNEPTIGSEAQIPFGGRKASGIGDKELGDDGLRFFTESKTLFHR